VHTRPTRPTCPKPRESEVEHLHDAGGCDLDIGGLQITVDDALVVRGLERVGDLARDREGFRQRQPGPKRVTSFRRT
jgi:hypothetical protein